MRKHALCAEFNDITVNLTAEEVTQHAAKPSKMTWALSSVRLQDLGKMVPVQPLIEHDATEEMLQEAQSNPVLHGLAAAVLAGRTWHRQHEETEVKHI